MSKELIGKIELDAADIVRQKEKEDKRKREYEEARGSSAADHLRYSVTEEGKFLAKSVTQMGSDVGHAVQNVAHKLSHPLHNPPRTDSDNGQCFGTPESAMKRDRAAMKAAEEHMFFLTSTDRYLIHLARALLFNPEVLVLH